MFSTYFPPQYSGAAKQAISLSTHLRERGHYIEFVTIWWPGLSESDEVEGFPVRRLETGRGIKHREFRLWCNLFRYVWQRRSDFDILHSHGAYYTNSIVGPLARLVGWKSLVKASMADNDLFGIKASLAGQIHYSFLRKVDICVAISRDLKSEFLSAGFPSERVYYIPNGVDTERFRPASLPGKSKLRRALGLPLDAPVALTVGVFDHRKNIGWLIEQWAKHDAFGTGTILLAIGPQSREDPDGRFLRSLRNLASKRPGILRLMDQVEDIERYYQVADLFVLPSTNEGMPNVVLEAMASGLPCVATVVSGTKELVRDGETGYTFEVGNPTSLRQAVFRVLNNGKGSFGHRGRKMVEEKYSLAVLAERYEVLYQNLVSSKSKST
ncbi:MAG: glycosyltransferase family 4 protein [Deltaproteobacteria bacterium]|nr:glycosyltransferase family 4 protein [Deltaproteobacteria bacterium]